ncbi:MAG: hypothetical protein AABY88_12430 [Pseudomonadota bacterium]
MKTFALLTSILALASACTGGIDTAAVAKTADTNAGQTVDLDTNIVFDKTDGVLKYRSPFDPATTIKLNAIVVQAKDSITKFDNEVAGIRASVGAAAAGQADPRMKAQAGLERLESLHAPVVKAKAEMAVARKELIASKRYFNNIVLSGMEEFINRVDEELNEEIKNVSGKLKPN